MTHDEDTALAGSAGVAGASRVGEVRRKSGHLVADSNGGWCLVAHDFDSIVANPPTDPQAFAELVVELDGGGVDDPALFVPVLELVLKSFEGIARGETDE